MRGLPGGPRNVWLRVAPIAQLLGDEHRKSLINISVKAPAEAREEVQRQDFRCGVFVLGTASDSQGIVRPVGTLVAAAPGTFTTAHMWHEQQVPLVQHSVEAVALVLSGSRPVGWRASCTVAACRVVAAAHGGGTLCLQDAFKERAPAEPFTLSSDATAAIDAHSASGLFEAPCT